MADDTIVPQRQAPVPPASLAVVWPDGRRDRYQLQAGANTVGREPGNDLVIADNTVSRQHARLTLDSQGLLAEDLGSSNGLLLNGAKISRQALHHGDRLKLGNCYLEVSLGQAGPAVAPPPPLRPRPGAAPPPAAMAARAPAALVATPTPGSLRRPWRWLLWLSLAGTALLTAGMAMATLHEAGFVLLLVGLSGLLAADIIWLISLHRCWRAIQWGPALSAPARTTPGKAVGFLFIPFFNFYWAFPAVWGLARDLNAYCRLHGVEARPVNEKLALATVIAMLAGVLFRPAYLVFMALALVLWARVVETTEAILAAQQDW